VAATVARTAGVPMTLATIPEDFLWQYRHETMGAVEGTCDPWIGVFLVLAHAAGPRYPVWMTGFLGDAATASYSDYADYAQAGDTARPSLFDRMFDAFRNKEGGFTEAELGSILRPEVAPVVVGATRQESRRLYESASGRELQRFMHWEWYERQRYFSGSYLRM